MEGAGAGARTMIPEGMQEFISTSPCSTFQAVGVSGSERTTSQAPGSPLPSSSFEKSYILRSMKCRYRLRLRLGSLALGVLPPFISTGLPGTLEAGLAEPWWMSGVGMEAWSRLLGCNLPPPASRHLPSMSKLTGVRLRCLALHRPFQPQHCCCRPFWLHPCSLSCLARRQPRSPCWPGLQPLPRRRLPRPSPPRPGFAP